MNRHNNRNSHWYSTLTVTVECVVCLSAGPSVPAQECGAPVFVASLAVSPLPPEFILNSAYEQSARSTRQVVARTGQPSPALQRKPTDTEAWERFEAEYRVPAHSPALGTRQIETGKFGLDTTVFAVDRFVKNLRDHADFEFDHGNMRRTRANSRDGLLANPRVKLDLDMLHGRPYVGARVVIPFGN